MNIYNIWCQPKEGVTADEFVSRMRIFLDALTAKGKMKSYRISRMKLGFRSLELPEFHVMIDFETMQDMDDAMDIVIGDETVDESHVSFNSLVDGEFIHHALYRDV